MDDSGSLGCCLPTLSPNRGRQGKGACRIPPTGAYSRMSGQGSTYEPRYFVQPVKLVVKGIPRAMLMDLADVALKRHESINNNNMARRWLCCQYAGLDWEDYVRRTRAFPQDFK